MSQQLKEIKTFEFTFISGHRVKNYATGSTQFLIWNVVQGYSLSAMAVWLFIYLLRLRLTRDAQTIVFL